MPLQNSVWNLHLRGLSRLLTFMLVSTISLSPKWQISKAYFARTWSELACGANSVTDLFGVQVSQMRDEWEGGVLQQQLCSITICKVKKRGSDRARSFKTTFLRKKYKTIDSHSEGWSSYQFIWTLHMNDPLTCYLPMNWRKGYHFEVEMSNHI